MLQCRPQWPRLLPLCRHMMDLSSVVSRLEALAPPALAESWDNVGLLVEPSPPHQVRKMLLTNDLTEDVLQEALSAGADLVLSYHPPIFKPLKRLTCTHWKERLLVTALEKRLAVYSPHTACDAIANGVNDWLARALGPCNSTVPLHPSPALSHPGGYRHILEFGGDIPAPLLSRVSTLQGVCVRTYPLRDGARVRLSCSDNALREALSILSEDPDAYRGAELMTLQKPPLLDTGMGRLCRISEPISISAAVERVKSHVGVSHLRLALGRGKTMESPVLLMAVCAGSGGSVLSDVPAADLYLTGEMSHHEVLDAVAKGRSVILCEHSNSERGYLRELGAQFTQCMEGKVEVLVSQTDRDPLQVV